MFVWVRYGEVESPERQCFCIDVTCDNLLDAVKQTVEEETARLIKRRDAELTINLRDVTFEEQQLAAKALRFESVQERIPPDVSSGLELARFRKTTIEGKITHLHASMVNFKGEFIIPADDSPLTPGCIGHSSIDLIDPSSGALQKLASNPRKKAMGLLRAGNTYEAARLDKNSSGATTSTPLVFSLSTAVISHTAPAL
ncbi:unnamed protein product [Pylaiella littoralis]